jgi:hypothetical protein
MPWWEPRQVSDSTVVLCSVDLARHLQSCSALYYAFPEYIIHLILWYFKRSLPLIFCSGSGKTITGELAILRLLRTQPGKKVVYVAPLKALARERLNDWRVKFGERRMLP